MRPRLQRPGKHTGLIRALRAEVPEGLCIYCECRLTGSQAIRCADPECARLYWADHRRQRHLNLTADAAWKKPRRCQWARCRVKFTPTDPRQLFHTKRCWAQKRLRSLRAATLKRRRAHVRSGAPAASVTPRQRAQRANLKKRFFRRCSR